jgi:hypothetical protein
MAIREDLRKYCGESAEQKLLILRKELMRPILTVQASAKLFEQYRGGLTEVLPENIKPEDLNNMIDWLSEAAVDLEEVLDILTSDCDSLPPHHRNN